MNDLPRTIAATADALRAGRISSLELTTALLDRIHASQDTIGAFIHVGGERALDAARQADRDFARGVDRGPLQGVPLGIKDIIATADAPTTANSRVLDPAWGQRPDATVVRQLRAGGAVLMGKLGLHEFATGWPDPSTGFRPVRNPWDLARTPGGSSSGTGAAVAADLIIAGLGTDTSGSIRGPAAFCGISGLKPTFGRVSKEGCVPLGYSLDNIGPMAHTAQDCALLLQAIAGYDPADPCTVNRAVPDFSAALARPLAGLRIGIPRGYFFDVPELDAEVRSVVLGAIEAMRQAGATVVDVAIPHAADGANACTVTIRSESYGYHERNLQTRPEAYGKWTRRVLHIGVLFTAADFVQAQRIRSIVKAEVNAAQQQVDVLIVPTMLSPAGKFAGYEPDARLTSPSYTGFWNMTGHPALSVPCGFTSGGLPIGMQIIGRAFDESTVLGVGHGYQQISDWHERRPPTPGGTPTLDDVRNAVPDESAPDPAAVRAIEALLMNARFPMDDQDQLRLARVYPGIREMTDRLRDVDFANQEPALIYPAG